MSSSVRGLTALLDYVADRLARGDVAQPMAELIDELGSLRQKLPRQAWLGELVPACRRHRLQALLLQDPYTRRAVEKPRGYAGDAVMIDYVYNGLPPDGTSPLGQQVFQATTRGPNGRSVLARRDHFAAEIDAVTARTRSARILSIGCGHLREAQASHGVRPGWEGTFYAVDQDEESLQVVKQEQSSRGLITKAHSVGTIVRRQTGLERLDLVYASGLFDYLSASIANRLTRTMFDMLRPGGKLIVANFVPNNHGRGYMEAFMDWNLICRDEAEMAALVDGLPGDQVACHSIYRDEYQNIVYLAVTRH